MVPQCAGLENLLVSREPQALHLGDAAKELADDVLVRVERQVADEEGVALGTGDVAKLLGAVSRVVVVRLAGRKVDLDLATINESTLLLGMGLLGVGRAGKVDVSKTLGPAALTVRDDAGTDNLAAELELLLEHGIVNVPAEVAHEQSSGLVRLSGVRLGLFGRSLLGLISLALFGRRLGLGLLLVRFGTVRVGVVRVVLGRVVRIGIRVRRLEPWEIMLAPPGFRVRSIRRWNARGVLTLSAAALAAFFAAAGLALVSSSSDAEELLSSSESLSEESDESESEPSAILTSPLVAGFAAGAGAGAGAGLSSESLPESLSESLSESESESESDDSAAGLAFPLTLPFALALAAGLVGFFTASASDSDSDAEESESDEAEESESLSDSDSETSTFFFFLISFLESFSETLEATSLAVFFDFATGVCDGLVTPPPLTARGFAAALLLLDFDSLTLPIVTVVLIRRDGGRRCRNRG